MIPNILFLIGAICFMFAAIFLFILWFGPVRADDNEIDVGLCYRHYQEACDRLNQLKILQIMNETRELWK